MLVLDQRLVAEPLPLDPCLFPFSIHNLALLDIVYLDLALLDQEELSRHSAGVKDPRSRRQCFDLKVSQQTRGVTQEVRNHLQLCVVNFVDGFDLVTATGSYRTAYCLRLWGAGRSLVALLQLFVPVLDVEGIPLHLAH